MRSGPMPKVPLKQSGGRKLDIGALAERKGRCPHTGKEITVPTVVLSYNNGYWNHFGHELNRYW